MMTSETRGPSPGPKTDKDHKAPRDHGDRDGGVDERDARVKRAKPKMPMDIIEIQRCIPHRYPFLLIDRVLEASPNERIIAIKNVSITDPVLTGHFPGNPVVPGVLIIEGIAQAAAVLGHLSYEAGLTTCYLTEVTLARFRRPVVPGDVMRFDVKVLKRRPPFFWFDATCTVEGEVAAEIKLSAYIK